MACEKLLNLLKSGVSEWNNYFEANEIENIDLTNADLRNLNLSGANLYKADLTKSDLSGANLSGANLDNANLQSAILNNAILNKAHLEGAILYGTSAKNSDFTKANLFEANLSEADFRGSIFTGALLTNTIAFLADLRMTDLTLADLEKANLVGANLRGSNLLRTNLTGATVNTWTLYNTRKVKNGEVGVNGIWAYGNDSAALMEPLPPGNSMQGSSSAAIIESLKHSRKLHGYSLSLVGVVLLIAFLSLNKVHYAGEEITVDKFLIVSIFMSIGLLSLVNLFMSDALKGVRYLIDRQSVMAVANFPWALSKYNRNPLKSIRMPNAVSKFNGMLKKSNWYISKIFGDIIFAKAQSYTVRFILSFHPLIYLYFLLKWKISSISIFKIDLLYLPAVALIFLCAKTFVLSQGFQKPILFDRKTEIASKDKLSILTDAVLAHTQTVAGLVDFLKEKGSNYTK